MGTLLRGDALLGSDLRGLRRGGGIEVTIASGGLLNCTRTIELNNQDLIVRTLVERTEQSASHLNGGCYDANRNHRL